MSIKTLTYDELAAVVGTAAVFRSRRRLQPAGGRGDKIFPPTYAGAVYALENWRVPSEADGKVVDWTTRRCVIVDAVQSCANRMEGALQAAIDDGTLALPYVAVKFPDAELLDAVTRVTSYEAPHRLADAILRDSELDGKPFRATGQGREMDAASDAYATPLFCTSPNALVYGMWNSTGLKGGLGAKFERAITSEMAGVGLPEPTSDDRNGPLRRGIRRDPLGIRAAVKLTGSTDKWSVATDPKAKGTLAPSELNHSSVPFDSPNVGVTVEYVLHTTVLSLIQLRRLRFPAARGGASTPERNAAAWSMLAAIGLCGAVLAFENGVDLRSRAVLFPEEPMTFDLLDRPKQTPERFALDCVGAIQLVKDAAAAVVRAGLPWDTEPLVLTPSKQLVQLVRKSQELAVATGVEGEG